MIAHDAPVRIFYKNMQKHGFRFSVGEDGALVVRKPATMSVSPLVAEEIEKRAHFLVELVQYDQKDAELQAMLGTPLTDDQAQHLKALAAELDVELEWSRINLNE